MRWSTLTLLNLTSSNIPDPIVSVCLCNGQCYWDMLSSSSTLYIIHYECCDFVLLWSCYHAVADWYLYSVELLLRVKDKRYKTRKIGDICCQTCGTHISVTPWRIFSILSSVELSRPVVVHCHGRLPLCPVWACPLAKNLSNLAQIGSKLCGTHISETAEWNYPI